MLLIVAQFSHYTHIVTRFTVFTYYIPTINYLQGHQIFVFGGLNSSLWIVYFGMEHEYGVWYFIDTSFDMDGTCSVSGGAVSPPPGHAPPARRAVLPGVLYKHMCSC
jgi:hypothetical protein